MICRSAAHPLILGTIITVHKNRWVFGNKGSGCEFLAFFLQLLLGDGPSVSSLLSAFG
jgi:hypothetical protein